MDVKYLIVADTTQKRRIMEKCDHGAWQNHTLARLALTVLRGSHSGEIREAHPQSCIDEACNHSG